MRHYLPHAVLSVKKKRRQAKKFFQPGSLILVLFSLFIFICMSHHAFAGHYRGGYISYRYLGDGQYEFIMKGYWGSQSAGIIYPRYEGASEVHGFPATVSKTLLPDGKTTEHVQRQVVSWSKPGQHQIYWKYCCMGTGSNYNGDGVGLFAVINYDPDAPSSSPQFYDLPMFYFKAGEPFHYLMNMEDPDKHEQEYSLEIPFGSPANVYSQMLESGFQLKKDGTIHWENPLAGKWLVNVRVREKVDGVFTGAYIDREFILNVSSLQSNQAPEIKPLEPKAVKAGESLSFEIEASDSEGQEVVLSANGSPFEKGASFTQNVSGSIAKGIFSWTPPGDAVGTYRLQFVATELSPATLSSAVDLIITVAECKEFTVRYIIEKKPCEGSSNGRLTLEATAGLSPFSYSLDNGLTFQSSSSFKDLAAGSYQAIIQDDIGCTSEPVIINLEEAPLPEVTLSLPSYFCVNTGATNLSGGSPLGGTYHGDGVENGVFFPEQAGVGAHTILYTVTDENGCSNTAWQEIWVKEVPLADAGSDTVVISGAGARACTTLTANATGGTPSYQYHWSTGETTQSIKVCPTETTTYILTVVDAFGCSDTSMVTVNVRDRGNGVSNGNKPDWAGQPDNDKSEKDKKEEKTNNGMGNNAKASLAAGNSNLELFTPVPDVVVYPNPLSVGAQLTVRLEEADLISLDIMDLSGRVVQQLYAGNIEARQELSFRINSSLGKEKVYICRILSSKGAQFIKVFVE